MKTISSNSKSEIIIKNSKFITLLYKISSESDVASYLEESKKLYPKATHYTYAYTTMDKAKASDDKEPSKTAGLPMLNVLQSLDLTNVLVITIRYFGGIKLGTGGLTRAYTKSVTTALENVPLTTLQPAYLIEITSSYDHSKELDYLLKDFKIINKNFTTSIIYQVLIPKESLNLFQNYSYIIIEDTYMET